MTDNTLPPEPGIYYDVPFDEYLAWPAFHKSDVAALLRSPKHWLYEQQQHKTTVALTMGSMIDCLVCEPDKFDTQFGVRPATYKSEKTTGRGDDKVTEAVEKPWNLNSNTCKQIAADLEKSGKLVVAQADVDLAKGAAEALSAHPLVSKWLAAGKPQVSFVWVDSETGVLCKGRFDLYVKSDDEWCVVDFKQSKNADRGPFRRDMTTFTYHVQGGLYIDGLATLTSGLYAPFYLAVVEPYPPFGVAVYPMGPDSLATGLLKAREAMVVWKDIQKTGKFNGYAVFQDELDVMPWAINPDVREVGLGG